MCCSALGRKMIRCQMFSDLRVMWSFIRSVLLFRFKRAFGITLINREKMNLFPNKTL